MRTAALVTGCLDRHVPLADLRAPGDGPAWSFAGQVRRDRVRIRPASGRGRGPVTFGRTRPDGVVWLFDTAAGTHLLLRPAGRGTWHLVDPDHDDRGSVHTAPGLVAVHLGPARPGGARETSPAGCSLVLTLVPRPADPSAAIPPAALRQQRAALLRHTPALVSAA
ncbi:hypothetical protein GCM10011381_01670 [Klenkia taihuensis]|nr:hypothetical protein GCM10011381_01670 [Klenkia taihuensis]